MSLGAKAIETMLEKVLFVQTLLREPVIKVRAKAIENALLLR